MKTALFTFSMRIKSPLDQAWKHPLPFARVAFTQKSSDPVNGLNRSGVVVLPSIPVVSWMASSGRSALIPPGAASPPATLPTSPVTAFISSGRLRVCFIGCSILFIPTFSIAAIFHPTRPWLKNASWARLKIARSNYILPLPTLMTGAPILPCFSCRYSCINRWAVLPPNPEKDMST